MSDLLSELLWRLKDIREELMSHGVSGRNYNMDEWSVPVVNLGQAIKIIENNLAREGQTTAEQAGKD